jgi:hypothetical protein
LSFFLQIYTTTESNITASLIHKPTVKEKRRLLAWATDQLCWLTEHYRLEPQIGSVGQGNTTILIHKPAVKAKRTLPAWATNW